MEIKAIHVTAVIATGNEKIPRWKGPLTKSLEYITRRAIGMPENNSVVRN
jgi:hypothetical protein